VDKKPSHEDIDKIFFDIINPKQTPQRPTLDNLRRQIAPRKPARKINTGQNGIDATTNRNQLSQ